MCLCVCAVEKHIERHKGHRATERESVCMCVSLITMSDIRRTGEKRR
jgi:hypothetical protein